jgi:hypothetical protein
MKFYFTEEFDIREWELWEVEADSFGEAWQKYAQLRRTASRARSSPAKSSKAVT